MLVGRLATSHGQGVALVERVRQGAEEGVRAGGAQRDGARGPGGHFLGQGRRRGWVLREGRVQRKLVSISLFCTEWRGIR